jgi:hypothetical protein
VFDAGLDQFAQRSGQSHAELGQFRQHLEAPPTASDCDRRFRRGGGFGVRVGGRDRVLEVAVKHGAVIAELLRYVKSQILVRDFKEADPNN